MAMTILSIEEIACMGFDAFRILQGVKPKTYTADQICAALTADASEDAPDMPAILFDGNAVYAELTRIYSKSHCHAPATVIATLDAVVTLMRAESAARPAPVGAVQAIPVNCTCGKCDWRDYYTGQRVTHQICAACNFKVPFGRAAAQAAPIAPAPADSAAERDAALWCALIADTGPRSRNYPCLRDDLADWLSDRAAMKTTGKDA